MIFFLSLRKFTNNSLRGLRDNYIEIIILVLVSLYVFIFYHMNTTYIEGMKTTSDTDISNLCDLSSDELNEKCKSLTSDTCNLTRCCIYLPKHKEEKEKCVAGNRNGPIFSDEIDGQTHFFLHP